MFSPYLYQGQGRPGRGCSVVTTFGQKVSLSLSLNTLISILRYHHGVLESFLTEAEKLSFVLTTMRCEEVESILAA